MEAATLVRRLSGSPQPVGIAPARVGAELHSSGPQSRESRKGPSLLEPPCVLKPASELSVFNLVTLPAVLGEKSENIFQKPKTMRDFQESGRKRIGVEATSGSSTACSG